MNNTGYIVGGVVGIATVLLGYTIYNKAHPKV